MKPISPTDVIPLAVLPGTDAAAADLFERAITRAAELLRLDDVPPVHDYIDSPANVDRYVNLAGIALASLIRRARFGADVDRRWTVGPPGRRFVLAWCNDTAGATVALRTDDHDPGIEIDAENVHRLVYALHCPRGEGRSYDELSAEWDGDELVLDYPTGDEPIRVPAAFLPALIDVLRAEVLPLAERWLAAVCVGWGPPRPRRNAAERSGPNPPGG